MDFSGPADAIASSIDDFTTYLSTNYSFIFDFISSIINGINGPLAAALTSLPAWVIIAAAVVAGILLGRVTLAILGGVGLMFILALNLWAAAMLTLSLVLTAAFISLAIGIPLGMLIAESKKVNAVIEPVLDFMQTMPPFVLLVPAVFFFASS